MTVSRRLSRLALAVFALVLPASALAAKPEAATVAKPTITWVKVHQPPAPGGIVVDVLVRHAPLADAAPGTQARGTVSLILSRYENERNRAIAAGSAAWTLPVVTEAVDVVYQVRLDARQSAAVTAASRDGVLRALVLVDERAKARGRAPAREGNFLQVDARVAAVAAPPFAAAPYLTANGRRVVIDADPKGRQFATAVTIPVSGGRTLAIAAHAPIPATGEPGALTGRATITGADGAVLATLPMPAGATLAVSPTGRGRGTLVWPAFEAPGTDPVEAGSALLSPPG